MLGVVGTASLVLGCLLLFGIAVPLEPSVPLILTTAAVAGVLALVIAVAVWRAHRRPVVTGENALVGAIGVVLSWNGNEGQVRLRGERWQARHAVPLAAGQRIQVTGREELTLLVEPDEPHGR